MADCFLPEKRSQIMAGIRSGGNLTTEIRFAKILRTYRVAGWRTGSKLPGKPDFVFSRQKLAIFIDGDFWHGNPKNFRLPKSNVEYWKAKIARNQIRDGEVNRALRSLGWGVLRLWESDLRDEEIIIARLQRRLRNRMVSDNKKAPRMRMIVALSASKRASR